MIQLTLSLVGRPRGLYGNAFARASQAAIRNACQRVTPPTISNILALEAPPGGYGTYRSGIITLFLGWPCCVWYLLCCDCPDEILFILRTAYSGYRAAVIESFGMAKEKGEFVPPFVVMHTGNWGTGIVDSLPP